MQSTILTLIKKPSFKIASSIIILAVLLYWLPVNELWKTLQKISILSWLLVLAGFIAGHFFGVIKWRLLINIGDKKLPLLISIQCYFAGLFANLFLPSLAGGDIVKAGLAIRYNKEKGVTIFGTLLDRIIDTGSVVFIIIIAAFLSPKFVEPQDQKILYSIIVLFAGLFVSGIIFMMLPIQRFENKKMISLLQKAHEILELVYENPVRPVLAFIMSLIIQSGFILLTVYLAQICDIHIPIVLWFLVWPLAKLSALLPISMGGIGVREVALAALLSRVSVDAANSVALGLLWETVLVAGGIFGGLLYIALKLFYGQEIPSLTGISRESKQIEELS